MCHFFDAPNWHGRCDMQGAHGENRRVREVGCFEPRDAGEPRAHLFGTTSAGDAAMADDYRDIPREAPARAHAISERTIFWGMIFTVLVAIAGMTRGFLG